MPEFGFFSTKDPKHFFLPNTVKTLIKAAALKVFSHNFGQNLLSKILSLLWLLFKGGSYLSAALINVITVCNKHFHFCINLPF